MTKLIQKLLENDGGISDFRLNITTRESYELFFVHEKLETVRATDTTDITVTVFLLHGGKLGDASFSVYASDDEAAIMKKISEAKRKALLVDNEPYSLPQGETFTGEAPSNLKDYDIPELAKIISEGVFAECTDGTVNALEIFIYKDTVSVKNSRGIDKTEVKYKAMVEAIPTYDKDGESVELYECYNFTELDAAALSAEIGAKMREVRDRISAQPPKEKLSCPVVLGTPELAQVMMNLARELNYAGVYTHSNAFSVGDSIQKEPKHDKLSVTMRGQMRGSVNSAAFDEDGLTARDTEIIKDGVASAYYGSVRYASYLGMEPTGNLRCMSAKLGSLSDGELRSRPYFRCASMSGIQVDIYNDYIGGEVRLAYYFDGEREIPVTGISISGKLSDALSGIRLSDTETVYEGYRGPKLALLSGIEIV